MPGCLIFARPPPSFPMPPGGAATDKIGEEAHQSGLEIKLERTLI
jgi:hypothetical protein